MRRSVFFLWALLCIFAANAQQFLGMSGLIQTPSAEMDRAGDARIGAHYLNSHTLPVQPFGTPGKSYDSGSFYLSLTPFSWIQGSYSIVLLKGSRKDGSNPNGYNHKDEAISLKVQPLKEGKWWPSIALGATDVYTRKDAPSSSQYFGNYYIAATKSFNFKAQTITATLAYRKFVKDYNSRWNGPVGGIVYRPSFFKDARAIAEWTGNEVNIGVDCLLFRHLLVQASLLDGRYFSGGLCYVVNLF